MLMQKGCRWLCVLAAMFVMASMAMAQEKLPDLEPVVVKASQGLVEVRNIGEGVAMASRVFVVCSMFQSIQHVTPCAAGLHLPGYIAKGNVLAFDVPALQPGGKYLLHLFGSGALPRRPHFNYGMKIIADLYKQIVETNESNNYTRLDTTIGVEPFAVSISSKQTPDLVAEASDPFYGIFYVENHGGKMAGKSKLLMNCDQAGQSGGCATSAEMERIYDPTLRGYVLEVPAIPAGKVQRVIFPMSMLTWERGKYTFSLRADASNVVAETREDNNRVSRSLQWDTGVLRIMASSNGSPVPVSYHLVPSGARRYSNNYHLRKSGKGVQTPVDISLPTGSYHFGIKPVNGRVIEQSFNVEIKAGKVFSQKVIFQQPGYLNMTILDDHHKKISRIYYTINSSGGGRYHEGGRIDGTPPVQVSLPPGIYDFHVYRKLSRYNGSKKTTMDISPIMGKDEQQVIRSINITSGQTVAKKVIFRRITPGVLALHVLSDGKPNQAYVNVALAKKNAPILFSFNTFKQIKLVPGRYRLTVRPKDEAGHITFQNAGYGSKRMEVAIRAGETLEKRISFVKARKGALALTVLVNGSRSKAKISIRKAGRKGHFNTVGASKMDFMPGHYDFLVWPVEHCISPGGIDVFHGGVSGPGFRTRRLPDVKAVILHDVEIKSGEKLKRTVEFKGVTRYTKICM